MSPDLGKPLEDFVENLVKSGRYPSRSAVLREGVRLVQERETRLEEFLAMIREGLDAADAGDTYPIEDVFSQLRAEIVAVKGKARDAG